MIGIKPSFTPNEISPIKCTTAARDLNFKLEVLAGVQTPHVGNLEITLSYVVCVCS
jgi:hypothetical protein